MEIRSYAYVKGRQLFAELELFIAFFCVILIGQAIYVTLSLFLNKGVNSNDRIVFAMLFLFIINAGWLMRVFILGQKFDQLQRRQQYAMVNQMTCIRSEALSSAYFTGPIGWIQLKVGKWNLLYKLLHMYAEHRLTNPDSVTNLELTHLFLDGQSSDDDSSSGIDNKEEEEDIVATDIEIESDSQSSSDSDDHHDHDVKDHKSNLMISVTGSEDVAKEIENEKEKEKHRSDKKVRKKEKKRLKRRKYKRKMYNKLKIKYRQKKEAKREKKKKKRKEQRKKWKTLTMRRKNETKSYEETKEAFEEMQQVCGFFCFGLFWFVLVCFCVLLLIFYFICCLDVITVHSFRMNLINI